MHRKASPITTLFLLLATLATLATKKIYAQWDIEDSHSTASLRGIHNVGGGVAWASGTDGTVLRSEDGGYLWQTCTIPPGAEKLDFRGIQAFDENTAIVMSSGTGDQSRLYKTTDGCQTWKLLFTNPDKEGFWDAIQFVNVRVGRLLGDPVQGNFRIWETANSGIDWSANARKGLAAESNSQGAFAASNSSLSFDLNKRLVSFGSGGKGGAFLYAELETVVICNDGCSGGPPEHTVQWQKISVPVASDTESSGIFSLAFERTSSVAVGGDYLRPNEISGTAAYSFDNAITWHPAQTPPHGFRSSVAYDTQQKLWITAGPNGTDISRDDGKNWTPLKPSGYDSPDADKDWNALSLPFVVGPHGRIGRLRAIPNPPK
jgi:photosystem II stability/assembly factor-like uncharacterized protein